MSSFVITNADIGTLTKEAQYSINQQITQTQGGTWSLTQTSAGLSFAGTDFGHCDILTNTLFVLVSYKNMDNNDLMNDQYDPDFDTLSMLSDDSGYYYSIFFSFPHKFNQTRQNLTKFVRVKWTNDLTFFISGVGSSLM